jgi:hypothetical protein
MAQIRTAINANFINLEALTLAVLLDANLAAQPIRRFAAPNGPCLSPTALFPGNLTRLETLITTENSCPAGRLGESRRDQR